MSRTLLFVPVETKVRELDGKLLFSLATAEAGFDVLLGGQPALTSQIHRFDRGIYIDKSVAPSKPEWFRACRGFGNTLTAWDEEGLVFFDGATYRELRVNAEAFGQVDRFFAWGEVQAAALREAYPDRADRVVVTGNPRFDLFRQEFRGFYEPRVRELKARFGRYILVNTGFAFYNHFRSAEVFRGMLSKYAIGRSRPGFFEGWIENHRQGFEFFRALLPDLRRAFPDHTLVIRPHPSENRDPWLDAIRGDPKAVVEASGSADAWILGCDCVIHFNCTTGIEAFLLDVPAIACRLPPPEPYAQPLPVALSYEASTSGEVIDLARRFTTNPGSLRPLRQDPERLAIAERNIAGIGGPLASDRIAQALGGVTPPPARRRPPADRMVQAARTAWRAALSVQRNLRAGRSDGYIRSKFPGLDLAEIREAAARLGACTGRFGNVRIVPSLKDCCLVTAEP